MENRPEPEAKTPVNSGPDPQANPQTDSNGTLAVRILADIFIAADEAEDFRGFRERLAELEESIQWSELVHGEPQAALYEHQMYEPPLYEDDLPF